MFKKSIPSIFIGLSVVVAVLVLGWVVFVKSNPVVSVQMPVVSDDEIVVDDDIPIVEDNDISEIDTSDWKSYRNEEFGFEVKYPEDWFIYDYYYDGEKHSENLYIQNFSRPKEGGFSGIGGTGCQLGVWIENNKYSSIQEWIDVQKDNISEDLEKVFIEEVQVGEMEGSEITFLGSFLGTGDSVIIILNNGIIYKISESWQDVPQENCQSIFDKILSTFEFIKS